MDKYSSKKGVSIYAYKGDAMTMLAFDLDKKLTENLAGFTIRVKAGGRKYYLNNRLSFSKKIKYHKKINRKDRFSSLYSPFQKFRWVHVPSSEHYLANPYFGQYTYEATPRYITGGVLQKINPKLTVSVTIDVSPFTDEDVQVGFTRAFVSSQAYSYHFGNNVKIRPNKTDLVFDVKKVSGTAKRWNGKTKKSEDMDYTFEEQHEYLGWQCRDRIMEFLDETLKNKKMRLDVFAYDLNEPVIVKKLMTLAKQGRLRIILDNYPNHSKPGSYEEKFSALFKKEAKNINDIFRGKFLSQAHSKVFIRRKNNQAAKAVKVLTGSTNFSTNGIYINANHVIIFNNAGVAQLYADVFDKSFGKKQMSSFKKSKFAEMDFVFNGSGLPDMTIRFSPHPKKITDKFFKSISTRIKKAESDVLFAIMKDDSKSEILDAVRKQVQSDKIFTYGITDGTSGISLYKPDSKKGVKVTGIGTETDLPYPFNKMAKIPGHNIHHKFIVADFKGDNPVVYCGSSNLAYNPEQKNGDNLLEIRDKDLVTAFAVEAIRLIDHFHWRNKQTTTAKKKTALYLRDNSEKYKWYQPYYKVKDLKYLERTILMK